MSLTVPGLTVAVRDKVRGEEGRGEATVLAGVEGSGEERREGVREGGRKGGLEGRSE